MSPWATAVEAQSWNCINHHLQLPWGFSVVATGMVGGTNTQEPRASSIASPPVFLRLTLTYWSWERVQSWNSNQGTMSNIPRPSQTHQIDPNRPSLQAILLQKVDDSKLGMWPWSPIVNNHEASWRWCIRIAAMCTAEINCTDADWFYLILYFAHHWHFLSWLPAM